MNLIRMSLQRLLSCRICILATYVLSACLLGCGKQETSSPPTAEFYEPDPVNHGSVADVLPKSDSIADMSIIYDEYPNIDLHTNESNPWHPTEPERSSILALFQNTQRVVVKQNGSVVGLLEITDRKGKKSRINVVIADQNSGELYSVSADSMDPEYVAYAPLEPNGHPLFSLFQKKSAEARK